MVRASMATRNKKDVTAIHNTDSQINNEVNMGKFPGLHRRAILVIAVVLLVVFFGRQVKIMVSHLNRHHQHKIFLCQLHPQSLTKRQFIRHRSSSSR